MSPRVIKFVVIVVIAGGLGIWRASSTWSQDSDEVRALMMELVQSMSCYADNKAIIDQCAERAHKSAFAQAYKPAGKRRASDIDAERYLEAFKSALSNQFDLLTRHDLKKCLADLNTEETRPEESEPAK